MKYNCDMMKDLMPLYHDGIASEASAEAVQEHMEECEACKSYYGQMLASDEVEKEADSEREEMAAMEENQAAESFKSVKKKRKKKITLIVVLAVVAYLINNAGLAALFMGLISFSFETALVEETTDIEDYDQYLTGQANDGTAMTHWGMDISIWPEEITDEMDVEEYHYVFYNPWDAQCLGYLVVDYDEEAYAQEIARLKAYDSDEVYTYYDVTGFEKNPYELVAMDADEYQGFIYALTDGESRIIYVELVFCNYHYDVDYRKYIPNEYLPDGFDATGNGKYTKEKEAELRKEAWDIFDWF